MDNYVRIFDTTLRDGEQSPGATLDAQDKLEIARQLARLGVDVIEAGFPAASPGDFDAVARIAAEVGTPGGPTIAGLSRATPKDLQAAADAVGKAAKPRIHMFLATSDIHMEHKLHMTRAQVLQRTSEMIALARSLCPDVEFSPEDGSRTDPAFLHEVLAAAIEAGATTLNIPDTVGFSTPTEIAALVRDIIAKVPGADRCIISVHCHDDLGMATANTLAALEAGARQAEVTINGIGERAGNAALEEVVMALHTRQSKYNLRTGIDTTQLLRSSHLVAGRTGISVAPNKAVIGGNAFAHEAGIHQDGVLKHQATYEIMRPESVGLARSRMVLGKHSGRHAFRKRLEELGHENLSEETLQHAFRRFKQLADQKKTVTDADLETLVADEIYQPPECYILRGVHVSCGSPSIPTATVTVTTPDEPDLIGSATGTGPVDAVFSAVDRVVGMRVELEEFAVHAVSGGAMALGEVTVRIRTLDEARRRFSAHGADMDIVVASARAYIAALNKAAVAAGIRPAGTKTITEETSAAVTAEIASVT
ncbi:MAG: 2-isopropylmalate synthase [Phycisphaerae bacterium]|nr:2-isopropylmalate synthase [Phycisphaerae bacterium]